MDQILSPATLEHCCRSILGRHGRHGLLPVRVALAASIKHGNDWFPVGEVLRSLNNVGKCSAIAGDLAQRIVELGIGETKLEPTRLGFINHVARLNCDLVQLSHFHGQKSMQLRDRFEIFYGLKPNSSPVAALLLIGASVFQIPLSVELRRFLLPEIRYEANRSMTGKVLKHLEQAGLLGIHRNRPGLKQPFLVYPL